MSLSEHVDKLRSYNFKITPQRLRVIEYINGAPSHFTAEDVHKAVVKVEPSITVATVYNILKAVTASGILSSFEANGTTWYETNMTPHANFVCLSCGKIEDMPFDSTNFGSSASKAGYKIQSVDIILRGYCQTCKSPKLKSSAR